MDASCLSMLRKKVNKKDRKQLWDERLLTDDVVMLQQEVVRYN